MYIFIGYSYGLCLLWKSYTRTKLCIKWTVMSSLSTCSFVSTTLNKLYFKKHIETVQISNQCSKQIKRSKIDFFLLKNVVLERKIHESYKICINTESFHKKRGHAKYDKFVNILIVELTISNVGEMQHIFKSIHIVWQTKAVRVETNICQ